ncbi:MAG: 6-pyruvoyl trahydropterin synthase family protein [Candidatus Omnitrophota bacterium]
MFKIERKIHFSYGHRIMKHEGHCSHLHGHNGRVHIEIASEKLDALDRVMDFSRIRDSIGRWIDGELDHKMILWEEDPLASVLQQAGEPVVLMKENPTAEAMARWIFREARRMGLPVTKVSFWETEHSCGMYEE